MNGGTGFDKFYAVIDKNIILIFFMLWWNS